MVVKLKNGRASNILISDAKERALLEATKVMEQAWEYEERHQEVMTRK